MKLKRLTNSLLAITLTIVSIVSLVIANIEPAYAEKNITIQDFTLDLDSLTVARSGTQNGIQWKVYDNGLLYLTGTQTGSLQKTFYNTVFAGETNAPYNLPPWSGYNGSADSWGHYSLTYYDDITMVYIENAKFIDMSKIFDVSAWTSTAPKIKYIKFGDNVDTSTVTAFNSMFYNLKNLQYIEGYNNLDTSKATNVSSMFYNCSGLVNETLDFSDWDFNKITGYNGFLYNCSPLILKTPTNISSEISLALSTTYYLVEHHRAVPSKTYTALTNLNESITITRKSDYVEAGYENIYEYSSDGTHTIDVTATAKEKYTVKMPAIITLTGDNLDFSGEYEFGAMGIISTSKQLNITPVLTFTMTDSVNNKTATATVTQEKTTYKMQPTLDSDIELTKDEYAIGTGAVNVTLPDVGSYTGTMGISFSLTSIN